MDHQSKEVQLLPGTKKRLGIKVPGENRFLYIGSVIFGAALVTSFAFTRYETSLMDQLSRVNAEILGVERQRDRAAEEKLQILDRQLEITSQKIETHIYWTQAFDRLVSFLQPEIQIDTLLGFADEESLSINAIAPSYTVVARQLASFLNDEGILDIELGKISPNNSGRLEFGVKLKIDKAKYFFKKSDQEQDDH